jgi:hypothetical protein
MAIVVGLYDYETNEELEVAKQYWLSKLVSTIEFSPIGPMGAAQPTASASPELWSPGSTNERPRFRYINAPCHRPLIRMLIQYDGEMCLAVRIPRRVR